jgi:hypothetical protein
VDIEITLLFSEGEVAFGVNRAGENVGMFLENGCGAIALVYVEV